MGTSAKVTEHGEEARYMASPLVDDHDLDRLVEHVGEARYVLLGEASHGTAEFYRWRARLTQRLIAERGFSFVAVEGDWPDCFRINRWIKGRWASERSARSVLGEFGRWPTWMWANEEVASFLSSLRDFNQSRGTAIGFYGLDVYSLWDSLHVVLDYLRTELPETLDRALEAVRCFEPYGEDPQHYARATRLVPASCEEEVVDLLMDLRSRPMRLDDDPEANFDARQNSEVLAGAERYYRTMVAGGNESWNVRDIHMADTLDRLIAHHGPGAKGIVWEHNTHVGDARGTDMTAAGMVNVGQLTRERHDDQGVVLVGFAGHRGRVIAADSWGAPMRELPVPEAPRDTHEDILHRAVGEPALLVFPDRRNTPWLSDRLGHRAIGVVYHPRADHFGNWVPTVLGRRYDALLSFDATTALHPLHLEPAQHHAEQETYPWAT